jgi:hypothetical protein
MVMRRIIWSLVIVVVVLGLIGCLAGVGIAQSGDDCATEPADKYSNTGRITDGLDADIQELDQGALQESAGDGDEAGDSGAPPTRESGEPEAEPGRGGTGTSVSGVDNPSTPDNYPNATTPSVVTGNPVGGGDIGDPVPVIKTRILDGPMDTDEVEQTAQD